MSEVVTEEEEKVVTKIVRLRPRNKKNNFFLGSYTVKGSRFKAGKWYEVLETVADYLRGVHSRPANPGAVDSVLCFNVCDTKSEAEAIVKAEKKAALRRSSAGRPTDLTTDGLRRGTMNEIDLSDRSDETEVDDDHEESPEELQARRQRSLRNADRMDKKTAKNKAAREAEKKRLAEEKAQAMEELDAANDHAGEGASEPEAIDDFE